LNALQEAVVEQSADPVRGHPQVAVVDTDSGFVTVLAKRFESKRWPVTVLERAGLDELRELRLSAVVVDPATHGEDRWRFLEELGRHLPDLAVVVCAARSTVAERVRGLHLAADDWVTKPCHPDEVVARLEAVLRRQRQATARLTTAPTVVGDFELRPERYDAFVRGRGAGLTRREFELLQVLVAARGCVVKREEIYLQVWGYRMVRGDRSVDVFVRKVRQKVESLSPGSTYIHTHPGVGYRFEPEPAEATESAAHD
jgi:DNA-binding response OmpR family regulator